MYAATGIRKPFVQHTVRNPSPRTLNAASMIAAALRPAPSKQLPALPTRSPSAAARQSDQYYWGSTEDREIELKDLCSWSSESFDDLF